jgi:two-component system, cell cycle response regulator
MEVGADDYLKRPIDIDEIRARLFSAHRVLSVYRAMAEQNAKLRRDSERAFQAARLDPLTQIPNRLRLKEDLEAIRSRALRYGERYCLAICDIDGFKQYNDHHGHIAGDHALRAIADRLRRRLRQGDSLYRYGGDELLIILPEQSLDEARSALERVRLAVTRLELPVEGGSDSLTISIGVAALDYLSDFGTWIERADAALYRAKEKGRNRVEVATSARALLPEPCHQG